MVSFATESGRSRCLLAVESISRKRPSTIRKLFSAIRHGDETESGSDFFFARRSTFHVPSENRTRVTEGRSISRLATDTRLLQRGKGS